jgi:alcohol dehydrogenase class IV
MEERINIFRTTPKIIFGIGSLGRVGEEAKALGAKKALIITDPGILKAGLNKAVEESLSTAGISISVFRDVEPEPRIEVVSNCVEATKKEKSDLLIALGGGSCIDTAKVTSIMMTNEGKVEDFFGIELIPQRGIPKIAIPTTAGSGSEVTPIAILSDVEEKLKKGIVSPFLFPDVSILDPTVTIGLPPEITASTGMDALVHAIEAYTSINATYLTDILAFEAMGLIYENLRTAYANGGNVDARSKMLMASNLAGIAFANAGVTAVHAFAYPIGAEYHIPHGVANALMLPHVMRFNILGNLAKFADIAVAFGERVENLSRLESAEVVVKAVERLANDINVPRKLRDFDIPETAIPHLAEGVLKVTRLLANNPRRISPEDAIHIYESAY